MMATYLVLNSWAGRRRYPAEVVGATPQRTRVRILASDGVCLPNRRFAACGEVVLVPTYAVVEEEADVVS